MKRYTLKTIKKTKVYQANIEAVRAMFPGHEEDFARELMIAADSAPRFHKDENLIIRAFIWSATPQGSNAWSALFWGLGGYGQNSKKGANQK